VNEVIRRRLARSPRLLAGFLIWGNRWRARGWRSLVAPALFYTAISIVTGYASRLAWLAHHGLFLAGLAALAASGLIARRRAAQRADAARSWTAALPVETFTATWTALLTELTPAGIWICLLMLIAPLATGLAISTGIAIGALLSYWAPARRAPQLAPGSRYVPQGRAAKDPTPRASLSALGAWPVRQMFASARPKAVARATVPILLIVPLGATADSAMLIIALFAVIGAFALLVLALIAVNKRARRWLLPLPLAASVLTRNLLARSLTIMLCMVVTEAWLIWVMESSAR
jgi:hypothetical protein